MRVIFQSLNSEFDPEAVLQKSIPHSFDVQPISNALICYSTVHGNSCVLYYYNVNGHQNS